jgi:nucleotide sugar dehydrogenase
MSNSVSDRKNVCIVGVGYVGEHLVESFSTYDKYNVIGFDLNKDRLEILKNKYKNCTFTNSEKDLTNVDLFCIAVPTLLNESKDNIEEGPITSVKRMLMRVAKRGCTVVIESSVYVGATRKLFSSLLGHGIYVGFSPERVDPGRVTPTHAEIPKIVSGLDKVSLDSIVEYYSKVINTVVPVSSTECAEMCKLYENCFRLINIAYINEISDLCKKYKVDPYEMTNAAKTKPFGFMPFYPGLGVGGYCIPVNPYYLANGDFNNLSCLYTSLKKTEMRPIQMAQDILNENKDVNQILVVGAAFKPGEVLLVNSPSVDLVNTLSNNGKNVDIYDPLVVRDVKNYRNAFPQNEDNSGFFNRLNIFKKETGQVNWIQKDDFNIMNLIEKYDIVIVTLKQHEIDWSILDKYERFDKKVYWFIDRNEVIGA